MSRKLLMGLTLAAVAAPSLVLAELPKADQTCINKMNNDGVKVQAAQLKVNDGCIADAVKTSLTPATQANTCIGSDPKGTVQKKKLKTTSDESKKCTTTPAAFFSGGVATNAAAETNARELARDVFGATLGSLQSCDTNAAECQCQAKVINRVSKLARAMAKQFLACKRDAMTAKGAFAPGGATTNAQLEQCLTNAGLGLSVAADTKQKIAKAKQQIADTAAQFCAKGTVDEFAAGQCSGISSPPTLNAGTLADCLENLVQCRTCAMFNATDALGIDCDAYAGITCP